MNNICSTSASATRLGHRTVDGGTAGLLASVDSLMENRRVNATIHTIHVAKGLEQWELQDDGTVGFLVDLALAFN